MKIGYMRVSTVDQELHLQRDALTAAGCQKLFEDTASGSDVERTGLANCLSHLREGDTLTVWKLDRLGRSLGHLIKIVADLKARGVGFTSLTEGINTETPAGELIFNIFGSLAQFEKELIRERTNAGLKAARARGRMGGRPSINPATIKAIRSMAADTNVVVMEACKTLGISRATWYRYAQAKAATV